MLYGSTCPGIEHVGALEILLMEYFPWLGHWGNFLSDRSEGSDVMNFTNSPSVGIAPAGLCCSCAQHSFAPSIKRKLSSQIHISDLTPPFHTVGISANKAIPATANGRIYFTLSPDCSIVDRRNSRLIFNPSVIAKQTTMIIAETDNLHCRVFYWLPPTLALRYQSFADC